MAKCSGTQPPNKQHQTTPTNMWPSKPELLAEYLPHEPPKSRRSETFSMLNVLIHKTVCFCSGHGLPNSKDMEKNQWHQTIQTNVCLINSSCRTFAPQNAIDKFFKRHLLVVKLNKTENPAMENEQFRFFVCFMSTVSLQNKYMYPQKWPKYVPRVSRLWVPHI